MVTDSDADIFTLFKPGPEAMLIFRMWFLAHNSAIPAFHCIPFGGELRSCLNALIMATEGVRQYHGSGVSLNILDAAYPADLPRTLPGHFAVCNRSDSFGMRLCTNWTSRLCFRPLSWNHFT